MSGRTQGAGWTTGTGWPRGRGATGAPLLALHGLAGTAAETAAEPLVLIAQILGWQVRAAPPGVTAAAQLCLAPLPLAPGEQDRGTLLAWSPDSNLNEHVSRLNVSVLDQPICIHRVEQLLQALAQQRQAARGAGAAAAGCGCEHGAKG